MNDRKFAQIYVVPNRDLISGLYRKIGIPAVAAALEAKADITDEAILQYLKYHEPTGVSR